jgi:hypothetical protein
MLRPPTFDQLCTHLHARPGYYHIVHFDGHGGYGPGVSPDGYRLEGAQGRLLFETETGAADPVRADQLGALLLEYRIPLMLKFLQGKCSSTLVRPCFCGRKLLSLFPFVPMSIEIFYLLSIKCQPIIGPCI